MADYDDRTGLGAKAHLYFSPEGSVESFPLPGGRRRWVVLAGAGAEDDPTRHLVDQVRRVSGHRLDTQRPLWESAFRPGRMLASRYGRGRMVLCGDAAHVMSPIGGQGMNTGFADAELLAALIERARDEPGTWRECLAVYERLRRRAFRVAAARAARGMWLGTRTGLVGSKFRAGLIRRVLLHPRWAPQVAARFAMLTIPYRDRSSVPPRFLNPHRVTA
jgi:2-polyprenyl-6-methoxyphenol hydroxylase-like FAD-dependent oxidoreductase